MGTCENHLKFINTCGNMQFFKLYKGRYIKLPLAFKWFNCVDSINSESSVLSEGGLTTGKGEGRKMVPRHNHVCSSLVVVGKS
jgi:hypothetical protein